MSQLSLPRQLNFSAQHFPGPLAHPCATTIPTPGGPLMLQVGGTSRLLAVATQLLAGHASSNAKVEVLARDAVALARALIHACDAAEAAEASAAAADEAAAAGLY